MARYGMRIRYLKVGDNDWGILLCWDYDSRDYDDMYVIMDNFGLEEKEIAESIKILSKPNTGMTVPDFSNQMSVVFISKTTSEDEWLNTLFHELKHVVEHISMFYRVDPQSEPAAYLQGEIGKQLFPIIMSRLCKKGRHIWN